MGSDAKSKSGLKVPKAPANTPLKQAPEDYRVLLALVMLHNQRVHRATVKDLAERTHIFPSKVVAALSVIFTKGWANLTTAHTPVDFEFSLPPEISGGLSRESASYRRHLNALARKADRAAAQAQKEADEQAARIARGEPPKLLLKPFTREDRAPFLTDAIELATQLEDTGLVEKVANCMARIGRYEVAELVKKAVTTPGEGSVRGRFFKLYEVRRAELLTPCLTATITQ